VAAFTETYPATLASKYLSSTRETKPLWKLGQPPRSVPERNERPAAQPQRGPIDVRLPCMVYAAIASLPDVVRSQTEVAVDEMRKAPGVLHVICYADHLSTDSTDARLGVAVITRGYWLARQALARLVARSVLGAELSDEDCSVPIGGVDAQVDRATAQFVGKRLNLWGASSNADRFRSLAARIAGIREDAIDLRSTGVIEREPGVDVLVPAIALARELNPAPVQVIVAHRQPIVLAPPREQDIPQIEGPAVRKRRRIALAA
jgi:hypothetical protein